MIPDIETFYLYEENICELHLGQSCEAEDFGQDHCIAIVDKNDCKNDDACIFTKWSTVYHQSGEMSEENNYQNYFKKGTDDDGNFKYWSLSFRILLFTFESSKDNFQ